MATTEVKPTKDTPLSGGVVLPTNIVKALTKSPKNLIIFSKPKVGKTTLLAKLDNCLIIDLESGTDYVDAMKIKASNVTELSNIARAIVDKGRPYKYVAVDTITALEEMCIPLAEYNYSKSSMGTNWFKAGGGKEKYGSILNMANGAGYPWLRQAFETMLSMLKGLAPHVILVGHIKDTMLEKNGAEFNSLDLDLTGKLKRITTSNADAIGYLYRKGNKNILSFKTADDIACGARPEHLRNQEIVVSEIKEDGTVVTNWDKIFID
jgi:hypothetical protein